MTPNANSFSEASVINISCSLVDFIQKKKKITLTIKIYYNRVLENQFLNIFHILHRAKESEMNNTL